MLQELLLFIAIVCFPHNFSSRVCFSQVVVGSFGIFGNSFSIMVLRSTQMRNTFNQLLVKLSSYISSESKCKRSQRWFFQTLQPGRAISFIIKGASELEKIAKAAGHKLPGKSSLNVGFVPSHPVLSCPDHHDHHDHHDQHDHHDYHDQNDHHDHCMGNVLWYFTMLIYYVSFMIYSIH